MRYWVSKPLNVNGYFGTFLVNIVGAFLLGIVVAYFQKEEYSNSLLLFLGVGFCGGLTTFSTFIFELLTALKNDQWKEFTIYLISSIIIGLLSAYIGFKIGEGI